MFIDSIVLSRVDDCQDMHQGHLELHMDSVVYP